MNGSKFSPGRLWAWTRKVACAWASHRAGIMKGVLACLALLAIFSLPAGASETEVGGGIIVVNGAHTEQGNARATASLVPAPLLSITHRTGRLEFSLETIPPERAQVSSSRYLALRSTQLSYLNVAARYRVTQQWSVGIGEMIYNQESLYEHDNAPPVLPLPPNAAYLTSFGETDRSRIVGLDFSVVNVMHPSSKTTISTRISLDPSLHGNLGVLRFDNLTTGSRNFTSSSSWLSVPETGSQFDVLVDAAVRVHKRATFHYGVRYLNMSMHFADGYLDDRNAFFVPFFGWSTTL